MNFLLRHKLIRTLIIVLICVATPLRAQIIAGNPDSLLRVFRSTTVHDTTRMIALQSVISQTMANNPDSALKLLDTLFAFASARKDIRFMGGACNTRGIIFKNKGVFPLALKNFIDAQNYFIAIGRTIGVASSHQNMAVVYNRMNQPDKSLEHMNAALKLYQSLNDEQDVASVYSDFGNFYRGQHQDSIALVYLRKSLEIRTRLNNKRGIAITSNNIAGVFGNMGLYDSALYYMQGALEYDLANHRMNNYITSLSNFGGVYNMQGNYKAAEDSCRKGLDLLREFNSFTLTKDVCECMYDSYVGQHNADSALLYYEKFIAARDSMLNQDNRDEMTRLEVESKYRQIAVADSLKTVQDKQIADAQFEGERKLRYALFAGLGLTLIFGIVMFNRFRTTRKQKDMIMWQQRETEHQKQLVDEKNQEITDSINYAQRIQSALLPSETELKKAFTDIFVLFSPRDIVSGDFYWYDESANNKVIAVADCTGHGVPGGFMSMLGFEILQDVVMLEEITTTSEALCRLDQKVTMTLNKNDKAYRDGMDMVLCAFPKNKLELHYSGANRPLLHFSDGVMNVYKPDKHTIGGAIDNVRKDYTMQIIPLKKGDMLYLFTDGYADQFGGEQGKKFMSRKLQEFLVTIAPLSCGEQKIKLDKNFRIWKGSLDQVDDVCVIGIRI